MARYNEEARILANLMKDKNQLKSQISGAQDVLQEGKMLTNNIEVEEYLESVKTRTVADGFILGHLTLGVLGTSELGEPSASFSYTVRRFWGYNTQTEFDTGTKSNIDTTNGDLRLT